MRKGNRKQGKMVVDEPYLEFFFFLMLNVCCLMFNFQFWIID